MVDFTEGCEQHQQPYRALVLDHHIIVVTAINYHWQADSAYWMLTTEYFKGLCETIKKTPQTSVHQIASRIAQKLAK